MDNQAIKKLESDLLESFDQALNILYVYEPGEESHYSMMDKFVLRYLCAGRRDFDCRGYRI